MTQDFSSGIGGNLPRFAIVILNWNGWKDTIICLNSVMKIDYPNYTIIVVDNASEDQSVDKILEHINKLTSSNEGSMLRPHSLVEMSRRDAENATYFAQRPLIRDKRFIIIKNDANYGFAEGNNVGIRFALNAIRAEYVFLLNNDTTVDSRCFEQPLELFTRDRAIGGIQSRLMNFENPDIVDSLGQALLGHSGPFDKCNGMPSRECRSPLEVTEIFGSCAAASFYRSETLRRVGLFDSDYFTLLEDVDLSWRIRLAEYTVYLAPESVVYHKGGISRRRLPNDCSTNLVKSYYSWANRLFIALTYYPPKTLVKFTPTYVLFFSLALFGAVRNHRIPDFLKALVRVLFLKRRAAQSHNSIKELQNKWIYQVTLIDYCRRILRIVGRRDLVLD